MPDAGSPQAKSPQRPLCGITLSGCSWPARDVRADRPPSVEEVLVELLDVDRLFDPAANVESDHPPGEKGAHRSECACCARDPPDEDAFGEERVRGQLASGAHRQCAAACLEGRCLSCC